MQRDNDQRDHRNHTWVSWNRAIALIFCTAALIPPFVANPAAQTLSKEVHRFRVYPHLDRAYRFITSRNLEGAKSELEACLTIDTNDATVWLVYFDVLYQLGEFDQIVESWERLGDLQENIRLRTYRLLGEVRTKDGVAALADLRVVEASRQVLSRPQLDDVVVRLVSLARDERREETLIDLIHAVPFGAMSASSLSAVAGALQWLGDAGEAISTYERVLRATDAGTRSKIEAYRALASISIEQRKWSRASDYLGRLHDLDPANLAITERLGDVAAAQGDNEQAVKWYREWLTAARASPVDERFRIRLAVGNAEYLLARYRDAAREFAIALRARPHDVQALIASAHALEKLGRSPDAVARLRAAVKVAPNGDLSAEAGLIYSRLERPSDALPFLERARDLGTSEKLTPQVLAQLGYAYAAAKREQAAREAFTAALRLSPNEPTWHVALGRVCAALEDDPCATEHLERSLALDDDPAIWKELGLTYARSGDIPGVERVAIQLSGNEPESCSELWRAAAETADRQGRHREAAGLFRRAALSGNPTSWQDLARSATSLEQAGALSEAAEILTLLASTPQVDADARAGFAERTAYVQTRNGRNDAAARSFELAIGLGHDRWRLHLDRALVLSKMERWDEALAEALGSLQRRDTARGRIAAAVCYKALGKPGMAIVNFARSLEAADALEIQPRDRKYVLDELTYLLSSEGELEQARAAAIQSLAIEKDPRITLAAVQVERRLSRDADARSMLGTIEIAALPRTLQLVALDEQATVQADLGDVAGAARTLEAAVAMEPSATRLFQLGELYKRTGELDRAVSCLERGVSTAPLDVRGRATLGYAYLSAHRMKDAITTLSDVAQQDPENFQVQQDLAYAHAALAGLERKYDGAAYFGYRTFVAPNTLNPGSALLLSQAGIELSRSLSGALSHWSLIGRFMMTVDQPDRRPVDGAFATNTPDAAALTSSSLQSLGVGIRYKPFADINLNLSAERLMTIGGDLAGSWLFRGLFSKERGADVRPGAGWRPYSMVYGDVAGFVGPYPTLLGYGEARLGAGRDFSRTWTVRPHLLMVARDQPVGLESGEAFQLSAGIGLTYRFNSPASVFRPTSLETRFYRSVAFATAGSNVGVVSSANHPDRTSGFSLATSIRF